MKEGQQIRLSGQGQSGIQGGENGDLYIEIYYKGLGEVFVLFLKYLLNLPNGIAVF